MTVKANVNSYELQHFNNRCKIMMAHSLTPTAPATAAIPISTRSKPYSHDSQILNCNRVCACHRGLHDRAPDTNIANRRRVAFVLGGIVLGLNLGDKSASAARRPPPPPPEEKKDPNISGLAAKVLASKKRKEAMKQEVAKLREKGQPIIP